MRIGVGVTTYNRPECLKKCLGQIKLHTLTNGSTIYDEVKIHVSEDTDQDRKGVAARKNECLRALKDCDHIFLLDDDTYPIQDRWIENFVNSEYKHLLYLTSQHRPFIHCGDGSTIYLDCGGVFMYMAKECVDKIGAFNEEFKIWGYEHAEYSKRIALATGEHYMYRSLDNTSEFIYAHDYSDPDHKSSISNKEKQKYFNENLPKFKEPIKQIYIPL